MAGDLAAALILLAFFGFLPVAIGCWYKVAKDVRNGDGVPAGALIGGIACSLMCLLVISGFLR